MDGIPTKVLKSTPDNIISILTYELDEKFARDKLMYSHHNPACTSFLKVLFQMFHLEQNE